MSVKRITIVLLTFAALVAFIGIGVVDAVKTKDLKEFQQVELKSKSSEIKELNVKYEQLNKDLDKASTEKDTSQSEVERLQKEKQDLEKQKEELKSQLQAKLDAKTKLAQASEKAVNAVTFTETASAQSGGSVTDIIRSASAKYGVSYQYMYDMALCESTLNPNARNPQPVIVRGVNYGHAQGLYQFIPSTWTRMSTQAGYSGASVTDAVANASTFAWAIKNGHAGEWECKR